MYTISIDQLWTNNTHTVRNHQYHKYNIKKLSMTSITEFCLSKAYIEHTVYSTWQWNFIVTWLPHNLKRNACSGKVYWENKYWIYARFHCDNCRFRVKGNSCFAQGWTWCKTLAKGMPGVAISLSNPLERRLQNQNQNRQTERVNHDCEIASKNYGLYM